MSNAILDLSLYLLAVEVVYLQLQRVITASTDYLQLAATLPMIRILVRHASLNVHNLGTEANAAGSAFSTSCMPVWRRGKW